VHHGDAVAREVDVEFETVGAERQPVIERRQRVFRPERGAATMRIDERAGEERLGQRDDLIS